MKMKILQWNVWYKEKIENIANLINKIKPDIACLQELNINLDGTDSPAKLAELTGYNYFYKPAMKFKNKHSIKEIGNGIYTRFPIIKTYKNFIQKPLGTESDKEGRIYIEILVRTKNKSLKVGTTHVSYTHRFELTESKKLQIDKLVKILKSRNKSFVFTGDINSTPDSYAIREITKHLKTCGPDFVKKTWATKPFSYKGFKENKLNWRLDYVFASKDIKVLSAKIIRTKFSDHLPVLTEIEV